MQLKKILLVYIIIALFTPALTINVASEGNEPPTWNKNWSYKQEIILPISTDSDSAKFQPIDIEITFDKTCWAKNEKEHSIRVVCWDGNQWHELESQVYDMETEASNFINRCGLVFLVPEFANGNERYFVYYDQTEKNPTDYEDHVSVEDSYYYYEPISGISAEGDYYKIIEDGYVVYGIGQKGKVIYRSLSQTVIKQQPKSENFGIIDSDNTVNFCFSYHEGVENTDEITSDNKLISKDISVDGNLMVEFRIVSESSTGHIRTSNVYKYYYCPTENKRINVHVKHQISEDITVKGIENVDGRYCAIVSYQSKSERLEKMVFGKILPLLHVYSEDDQIREYKLDLDPDEKSREWIISYKDDEDLGKNAWISYDEGESGKAQAIIFSENQQIVKTGRDERDGIQLSVAEREFLDALGAEIDIATIALGRNSYEKGSVHDLKIPNDLFVEYHAEFFTTEKGGYPDVIEESKLYKELVKHRHEGTDDSEGNKNIYTLTVVPRLTGRLFSYPFLTDILGINLSSVFAELYLDGKLVATSYSQKPYIGAPRIKFPKIAKGNYTVKVFRKKAIGGISYIGFESVKVEDDTKIDIYCTWPKNIEVSTTDQNKKNIENIELFILKNNTVVDSNFTEGSSNTVFTVPFNLFGKYMLKAVYKGFIIYEEKIPLFKKDIEISTRLYDVIINVEDDLGFAPDVNLKPFLTSSEMDEPVQLSPQDIGNGQYLFDNILEAPYDLYISYGSFSDVFPIKVSKESTDFDINFEALYDLKFSLFDSRGNPIENNNKEMSIYRGSKEIISLIPADTIVTIPPGSYKIHIYSDNQIIGIKNFDVSNDKEVRVVTNIQFSIPLIITIVVIIFIIQIIVLLLFKRISLNTFLKLLAMGLILLSLFQPWWGLNALAENNDISKNTEMFLVPGTMIESLDYKDITYLDLATIPEIFITFLGGLLLIVSSGFVLLGLSFIPNILYKRRFYIVLITASILFLILVAGAYIVGMSKLTELSLGSLQGEGVLEISLPDKNMVYMNANWGLGLGFYLCVSAAIIAFLSGFIDYLRKKLNF